MVIHLLSLFLAYHFLVYYPLGFISFLYSVHWKTNTLRASALRDASRATLPELDCCCLEHTPEAGQLHDGDITALPGHTPHGTRAGMKAVLEAVG